MGSSAETRFQRRCIRCQELLLPNHRRQGPLEQLPNLFVIRFLRQNVVPLQHAPSVSVYHEDRMISRIEKN